MGCCRTSTSMCPMGGPNPEDVRASRLWGDSRLSPKSINERQTPSCLSSTPFPFSVLQRKFVCLSPFTHLGSQNPAVLCKQWLQLVVPVRQLLMGEVRG